MPMHLRVSLLMALLAAAASSEVIPLLSAVCAPPGTATALGGCLLSVSVMPNGSGLMIERVVLEEGIKIGKRPDGALGISPAQAGGPVFSIFASLDSHRRLSGFEHCFTTNRKPIGVYVDGVKAADWTWAQADSRCDGTSAVTLPVAVAGRVSVMVERRGVLLSAP